MTTIFGMSIEIIIVYTVHGIHYMIGYKSTESTENKNKRAKIVCWHMLHVTVGFSVNEGKVRLQYSPPNKIPKWCKVPGGFESS